MDKVNINDLSNVNLSGGINTSKVHKDALIDTKKALERPPTAISMGEISFGQEVYPRELASFGNFSTITGASKSKKTFFKSLMVASFIGGQSANYAGDMKTHRTKDMYVLDFDTEQSAWHSQRVAKRTLSLVGEDYPYYKPFYLRRYSYQERLEFIDWCLLSKESPYYGNIGFVCVDGFADLVKEVNDLVSCNELVTKMLKWTDVTQCHLTGVLHSNYGASKPTGHLGSAILKKAETVCELAKDESNDAITNVKLSYTRGFPIDDFSFKVNDQGLPIVVTNEKLPF